MNCVYTALYIIIIIIILHVYAYKFILIVEPVLVKGSKIARQEINDKIKHKKTLIYMIVHVCACVYIDTQRMIIESKEREGKKFIVRKFSSYNTILIQINTLLT